MTLFNKKKSKKVDLLEMSALERIKTIRAAKETLRLKSVEAKIWQSFMQAENLTLNGQVVNCDNPHLKGLSMSDLLKTD